MRILFISSLIFFLLARCSSNINEIDDLPPTFELLNLSEGDTVKNEITIRFEAMDNIAISYVEFYVNEELIDTIFTKPYEFKWNTLGIEDGKHNLRFVTTDMSGNIYEKKLQINVNNVLVSIKVEKLSQSVNEGMVFILTDLEGKILNKVEFLEYGSFMISSEKPFEEDNFNLYFVKKHENLLDVFAYLNLKKGSELSFVANKVYVHNSISVNYNLKEYLHPFNFATFSSDRGGRTVRYNSNENKIAFNYSKMGKIMVMVESESEGFYTVKEVPTDTDSIYINLNDCTIPLLQKKITVPKNEYGSCALLGWPGEDKSDAYFLINKHFYGQELKLFYPDVQFTNYTFSLTSSYNDYLYSVGIFGDLPDKIEPFEIVIKVINPSAKSFAAEFNKDFDYYKAEFYNSAKTLRVTTYSPYHLNQFKLADLSVCNLPNFNLSDINLDLLVVYDISNFIENEAHFKYFYKYPHDFHPMIHSSFIRYTPNGRLSYSDKFDEGLIESIWSDFY